MKKKKKNLDDATNHPKFQRFNILILFCLFNCVLLLDSCCLNWTLSSLFCCQCQATNEGFGQSALVQNNVQASDVSTSGANRSTNGKDLVLSRAASEWILHSLYINSYVCSAHTGFIFWKKNMNLSLLVYSGYD